MLGRVTRKKTCQPRAPSVTAASSWSLPCDSISGISSRATKGNVTNTVAMTMPGKAKTIFGSASHADRSVNSQPKPRYSAAHAVKRAAGAKNSASVSGGNQPLEPKIITHTRPAMTGETANGRSMRESRKARPLKRYFVTSQAAETPNSVLSGTEDLPATAQRFGENGG